MSTVDPEDNVVNVGEKDIIRYLHATRIQAEVLDEVRIQARGRYISKAVDIAEIVTSPGNHYLRGWEKESVVTGTDPRPERDGQDRVSRITITIRRAGA